MNDFFYSMKIKNERVLLSSEFLLASKGKEKDPVETDFMLLLAQHGGKLLPYQSHVLVFFLPW